MGKVIDEVLAEFPAVISLQPLRTFNRELLHKIIIGASETYFLTFRPISLG